MKEQNPSMKNQTTFKSDISKIEFPESEKVPCKTISKPVLSMIQEEHPKIGPHDFISSGELNAYRQKYIAHYLSKGDGELSELETVVQQSMANDESLVSKMEDEINSYTFGQRVAD